MKHVARFMNLPVYFMNSFENLMDNLLLQLINIKSKKLRVQVIAFFNSKIEYQSDPGTFSSFKGMYCFSTSFYPVRIEWICADIWEQSTDLPLVYQFKLLVAQ